MKNRRRNRRLVFERLEMKATPSTLLLAIAPLDNAVHVAVEEMRERAANLTVVPLDQASQVLVVETRSNWQFQISTLDVLRFIERNSEPRTTDSRSVTLPSSAACEGVDDMMKLEDGDVRALVIADSLTHA